MVNVEDIAGNVDDAGRLDTRDPQQRHLGTNVQKLNIGTTRHDDAARASNPSTNSNGGVAGAQASQVCNSPRLSFTLVQKPMRDLQRRPVLQYGKRYRFNGRLTCVINGKRVSAPKRTRVDILNKVGKKTYRRPGRRSRDKGRLTIILTYPSSRTLTFRFTNADGQAVAGEHQDQGRKEEGPSARRSGRQGEV